MLLLINPPDRVVTYDTMIAVIWPDPDEQPLTALNVLHVLRAQLRRKGIYIETDKFWGFSIPEREMQLKLAA